MRSLRPIRIGIANAIGLPSCGMRDGKADAYVVCKFIDVASPQNTVLWECSTTTHDDKDDPVWEEIFESTKLNLYALRIEIEVYDKNKTTDTLLGKTMVRPRVTSILHPPSAQARML